MLFLFVSSTPLHSMATQDLLFNISYGFDGNIYGDAVKGFIQLLNATPPPPSAVISLDEFLQRFPQFDRNSDQYVSDFFGDKKTLLLGAGNHIDCPQHLADDESVLLMLDCFILYQRAVALDLKKQKIYYLSLAGQLVKTMLIPGTRCTRMFKRCHFLFLRCCTDHPLEKCLKLANVKTGSGEKRLISKKKRSRDYFAFDGGKKTRLLDVEQNNLQPLVGQNSDFNCAVDMGKEFPTLNYSSPDHVSLNSDNIAVSCPSSGTSSGTISTPVTSDYDALSFDGNEPENTNDLSVFETYHDHEYWDLEVDFPVLGR